MADPTRHRNSRRGSPPSGSSYALPACRQTPRAATSPRPMASAIVPAASHRRWLEGTIRSSSTRPDGARIVPGDHTSMGSVGHPPETTVDWQHRRQRGHIRLAIAKAKFMIPATREFPKPARYSPGLQRGSPWPVHSGARTNSDSRQAAGLSQWRGPVRILSADGDPADDQVEAIHHPSLEVLRDIGVIFVAGGARHPPPPAPSRAVRSMVASAKTRATRHAVTMAAITSSSPGGSR